MSKVKFTTSSIETMSQVPIADGQIVVSTDAPSIVYDIENIRRSLLIAQWGQVPVYLFSSHTGFSVDVPHDYGSYKSNILTLTQTEYYVRLILSKADYQPLACIYFGKIDVTDISSVAAEMTTYKTEDYADQHNLMGVALLRDAPSFTSSSLSDLNIVTDSSIEVDNTKNYYHSMANMDISSYTGKYYIGVYFKSDYQARRGYYLHNLYFTRT